jgi:enoyl-[acyl-carrier protein] reductase I
VVPLMEKRGGGSVLTLTYLGSDRVFPNYNVMGVAKAALESSVRYLAADLGPKSIRVNAISAGAIKTLAASGIGGFSTILQVYRDRAPLRRSVDTSEVADAALFLLGPASRAVTGEVLMVDSGFHAMGL